MCVKFFFTRWRPNVSIDCDSICNGAVYIIPYNVSKVVNIKLKEKASGKFLPGIGL